MAARKPHKKQIAMPQDITIEDAQKFMQQREEKTTESAVWEAMKHLGTNEKQHLFSELSETQIKLITKLTGVDTLTKKAGKELYKPIVDKFIQLMASKNRKSRGELLAAIKNAHPEQQQGMFNPKLRELLS